MGTQHGLAISERFWAMADKSSGCWLWQGAVGGRGYGNFRLGGKKTVSAHRMAFRLTYGEILDGLYVCHRCDNRVCVRPDHLFLGTAQDNAQDCIAKGRAGRRGKKPANGIAAMRYRGIGPTRPVGRPKTRVEFIGPRKRGPKEVR